MTALSENPSERALQLLETLRQQVRGDFYAFFRLVRAGGDFLYSDMTCLGDPLARQDWCAAEGWRLQAQWDPTKPHRRALDRFSEGFETCGITEAPVWRAHYAPFGLQHQRRMLVYDGDTFCGWIGVLRHQDSPDFSDDEQAQLMRAAPSLRRLVVAHRRLCDAATANTAHLIMTPQGGIELGSAEANDWLTRERQRALVELTRRADAREPLSDWQLVGGRQASVVRLEGHRGARYLWTLEPAEVPSLSPLHQLSARKRQACELAAAGATAPEIANYMGISRETARGYLKESYQLLQVSSRLELAERLKS